MRSRLALLAVPLLLISLLPGAVSAAPPDAAAAHRAAVLAYWTPERMAAAIPRDFVFSPGRGIEPLGKPTKPPVTTDTTTGASWTAGGKMLTATGRVYFVMDGQAWICSGSVITDSQADQSIVLTAGHCVVDETDGVFATEWMFIPSFDTSPSYDCASTTYGCWVADALYADAAFASAGGFTDTAVRHDWGFAVVGPGGKDDSQLDASARGSFPIEYTQSYAGQELSAFGYPAAGKYHGSDLVYCRGVVGTDPNTAGTTWSMPCGMTGGSSGGPWVQAGDPAVYADAVIGSLNSYGYQGLKYMFGPMFNGDTQNVFEAAKSGTEPSGVARALLP